MMTSTSRQLVQSQDHVRGEHLKNKILSTGLIVKAVHEL